MLPFLFLLVLVHIAESQKIYNTVCDKIPNPCTTFPFPSSDPGVTFNVSNEGKAKFDHALGRAAEQTAGALWASRELLRRLEYFVEKAPSRTGASCNDTSVLDTCTQGKLLDAFGTGVPTSFHGAVGDNTPSHLRAILETLESGNLREQVNFAYAIIKNKYFDDVVSPLAAEAIRRGDDSKLLGLGLRPDTVLKRYADIQESAELAKKHPELKYSNTITSWSFPPFNSWTRFLFDGPNTTAYNSWAGCRPGSLWVNCSKEHLPSDCHEVPWVTNNASIYPVLSADEVAWECSSGGVTPCKLKWTVGARDWLHPLNFPLAFGSSQAHPGYVERAEKLGYRIVAGPSGTTDNIMTIAGYLNFTPEEMVLVRLACLAWMVPLDDHSFWEIMLGGAAHLGDVGRVEQRLEDLAQLYPQDVRVSSGGPMQDTVYLASDLWGHLKLELEADTELWEEMTSTSSAYLRKLIGKPDAQTSIPKNTKLLPGRKNRILSG